MGKQRPNGSSYDVISYMRLHGWTVKQAGRIHMDTVLPHRLIGDPLVGHDVVGLPLAQDGTVVQDVGAVDDVQRIADVVVGDQDAEATLLEVRDEVAREP